LTESRAPARNILYVFVTFEETAIVTVTPQK
jgi:hypothetical protein